VPTTGGNPTPTWTLEGHLAFNAGQGISRSVIAFSAPGANVYPGDKRKTLALARLINEQTAAYARAYPDKFAFYAVVPLPYTQDAIAEMKYAFETLGAAGIVLFSNYEGRYLGDPAFTPFFQALNARGQGQLVYVHPSTPYIKVDGKFIEANPTTYPTGMTEFFFETARTLQDLTISQTIHNFTNVNYIIPHVGGAFPAILDRFLKSLPQLYDASLKILQTRFFWDSAGPTYYHQVAGLLGYIPASQLLYGTDYPYAPIFTYGPSLAAVQNSNFVTDAQKTALFTSNAQNLFGNRLPSG
jgi:predicted TIM-barrel fold metal-dependent hydrolase